MKEQVYKENFALSSDHYSHQEQVLFRDATNAHYDYFQKIRDNIPKNVQKPAYWFVEATLGDYLHDINEVVVDDPEYQLECISDGDVLSYVGELKAHIEQAKNAVINMYLCYWDSYEELKDVDGEDMSDVSTDYVYGLGSTSLCEAPSYDMAKNLSKDQMDELNELLKATGFSEFSFNETDLHTKDWYKFSVPEIEE